MAYVFTPPVSRASVQSLTWEPATLSPEVQAQGDELLARMDAGDLSAACEYADLAASEGWPCWGMTWEEWASEVTARPLPQRVGDGTVPASTARCVLQGKLL
jgi:hypothetical protein